MLEKKRFYYSVYWIFIKIDTPPGTSDEHLTLVEFIQANFNKSTFSAVLVTTPQVFILIDYLKKKKKFLVNSYVNFYKCVSLIDVQKEIAFCQSVGLKIEGIFENMSGFVCPTCTECTQIFGRGGGKSLCEMQNLPYLGTIYLLFFTILLKYNII